VTSYDLGSRIALVTGAGIATALGRPERVFPSTAGWACSGAAHTLTNESVC